MFTTNEDGQVVLHIQDDGIGIKREDLPRVFRKSYTGTIGRETSAATGMGFIQIASRPLRPNDSELVP